MTDSLEVLVVRLDGHLLGLPVEQLGRITTAAAGPRPPPAAGGRPECGARARPSEGSGAVPGSVWVEIRSRSGMHRVRVDGVVGMATLGLAQIRHLPPLIRAQKASPYLWGFALLDDGIVCLVDPDELGMDGPGAGGILASRLHPCTAPGEPRDDPAVRQPERTSDEWSFSS